MPHVSQHVAVALARHIDQVFGLMGNGNAHFLDAILRHTSASFTAVRHEAGAVVAADAHYRASGRIAAATTTYGAGFTNTLTALAEAAQARVPLVLIVGDEPTSGPRPWDVDQIALASAVGVRTYTAGRLDAAASTVIAIEHALSYRVPVVLAIPYDVPTLEAGEVPPTPPLHLPQPSEPRLARICRAIVRHPERQDGAADWARALGVDPKTVHRLFLRHTGMTFGRWRQQARLLAAMERLARGEQVLDVSLDLGYESPSAFAAMFRKALGESPSAFAARSVASA